MELKLYPIGKAAKYIGVRVETLRVWEKEGKLIPDVKTDAGHRRYSKEQLDKYLFGIKPKPEDKLVIGYCRVSSSKQKDDLNRQISLMEEYLVKQGYKFKIITDIGSGINYNKKGLNELIKLVIYGKVKKVVVLYKDRLVRFGFELIENICHEMDVDIEIINNIDKEEDQELVEDLVQIITVYSCRLQGRRRHKLQSISDDVKNVVK